MARSDLTADMLARLVGDDDLDGIIGLLEGANDRDRSRARPFIDDAIERHLPLSRTATRSWAAAILGTGKPAQIALYQWWWRYDQPLDEETVATLIGERSERFRRSLLSRLLKGRFPAWPFIYPLVRQGILEVDPSTEMAYLRVFYEQGMANANDDERLLRFAVPALLRTPGIVNHYTGQDHIPSIVTWVAQGRLDRAATIDATLTSLLTDLGQNELRWFAVLLRQLEPSIEEMVARQDAVIGLLSASHPEAVKVGLELVTLPRGDERVDELRLVGHLRAPLTGDRKNLAMAALELLDGLARDGGTVEVRDAARLAVVDGLLHVRPDVGRRSLGLLRCYLDAEPDEGVRIALADMAPLAAPTLRAAVSELAGVAPIEPAEADGAVVTTVESDRGRPDVDVEPIGPRPDLDEVVAIFTAALEGEGTADDLERAIAAALAMGGRRPAGFADLVSPLRKRAGEKDGAVAAIVRAWVDPTSGPTELGWRSLPGPKPLFDPDRWGQKRWIEAPDFSWSWRAHEIAIALRSLQPEFAWAEPTERGGSIAGEAMSQRRELLPGLGQVDRDWAALRTVDARGRVTVSSWRIDRFHSARGLHVEFDIDPALVDVPLIRDAGDWLWRPDSPLTGDLFLSLFRNLPAIPIAAATAVLISFDHLTAPFPFDLVPVLHFAAERSTPMDGTCPLLLVLAMTHRADLRAAAIDALAAGIVDDRIGPTALADATARLHDAERLVLARLADPLTELATLGARERRFAQRFMLELVSRIGGARPTGLHALLETLAQSCVGGVDIPASARTVLEDLARRQSKAGRSAREILAMDDTNR